MMTLVKALPYLVYGALATFLLVSLLLFIGCLRRKHFWPIFRRSRDTRTLWLAAIALLNPVLTVMYLVFGRFRRPDAPAGWVGPAQVGVVVIALGVAGFLVNIPGLTHLWMAPFAGRVPDSTQESDWSVSGHAGVLDAQSETGSTTVSTSPQDCRVVCRRIAVLLENDAPLLRLIAWAFREQIGKLPFVEEVTIAGMADTPAGSLRPDVFVRIDARDVRITPIPYAVSLAARIEATAGTMPYHGVHRYHDGRELPMLEFSINITVDHRSRTFGYESTPHQLAARHIAEQIARQLQNSFENWLKTHGPMPVLPPAFYRDFLPAELPPPLAALANQRIGAYVAPLTYHESHWLLSAPRGETGALFARLATDMTAGGWKKIGASEDLRMEKDSERIHALVIQERTRTGWTITPEGGEAAAPDVQILVRYRQMFGAEERKAAVESLLESDAPLASLLLVKPLMDPAQKKRLLARIASWRSPSALAFLELCQLYIEEGRFEDAAAALRRARAALRTSVKPDDLAKRADDAAKRLLKAAERSGAPDAGSTPDRFKPALDDYLSAGFRELPADGSLVTLDLDLDEPAGFLLIQPEGALRTFACTVRSTPHAATTGAYTILCVETEEGSRQSHEQGSETRNGRWRFRHVSSSGITVEIEESDRAGRFRVIAHRARRE